MKGGKFNFSVKLNAKIAQNKSVEENNQILIKKFLRKWKKSGILKDLRKKTYPLTKGMMNRRKKHLGKKRANKK